MGNIFAIEDKKIKNYKYDKLKKIFKPEIFAVKILIVLINIKKYKLNFSYIENINTIKDLIYFLSDGNITKNYGCVNLLYYSIIFNNDDLYFDTIIEYDYKTNKFNEILLFFEEEIFKLNIENNNEILDKVYYRLFGDYSDVIELSLNISLKKYMPDIIKYLSNFDDETLQNRFIQKYNNILRLIDYKNNLLNQLTKDDYIFNDNIYKKVKIGEKEINEKIKIYFLNNIFINNYYYKYNYDLKKLSNLIKIKNDNNYNIKETDIDNYLKLINDNINIVKQFNNLKNEIEYIKTKINIPSELLTFNKNNYEIPIATPIENNEIIDDEIQTAFKA